MFISSLCFKWPFRDLREYQNMIRLIVPSLPSFFLLLDENIRMLYIEAKAQLFNLILKILIKECLIYICLLLMFWRMRDIINQHYVELWKVKRTRQKEGKNEECLILPPSAIKCQFFSFSSVRQKYVPFHLYYMEENQLGDSFLSPVYFLVRNQRYTRTQNSAHEKIHIKECTSTPK